MKGKATLFVLVRRIRFTLLEEFILKVLEMEKGCPDERIADILCLQPGDISLIIEDEGLKDIVQGDASRRTIKSEFTGKEWGISTAKKWIDWNDCSKECSDFFRQLQEFKGKDIPKKLRVHKAGKYYLFDRNITKDIPDELREYMEGIEGADETESSKTK